jgi:hypothetical protein
MTAPGPTSELSVGPYNKALAEALIKRSFDVSRNGDLDHWLTRT